MAGFVGGTPASFNGATWVAAVAAPASGKQREVLACHVDNLDTVQHTFKSRKKVGVTGYEVYPAKVIAAGARGQLVVDAVVLDATDMSYEVAIEGAHTTTAPQFDVAVFEVP
jgi:hypothetical protein